MTSSENSLSHTDAHSSHDASGKNIDHDPRKDPKNYVLKVFYCNPDDPSLLVPMRWGSGVDFNYGRWAGKVLILLILLGLASVVFNAFF